MMKKFFAKKCFNQSEINADANQSKPKEKNVDLQSYNFTTDFKEEKFSFTWRIENIHRCNLKCQEFLQSPTFCTKFCGEAKWVLKLYPRGRKLSENFKQNKTCEELDFASFFSDSVSSECEKVGLFIQRISTNPVSSSFKYHFVCERNFLSNDTSKIKKIYSYPDTGLAEIITDLTSSPEYGKDDLYCPEDYKDPETLIVRCEIYVTNVFNNETPFNYVSDLAKSSLFQDFKEMFETGKFSDIILQSREVKFKAHKCILASRSKVFDAMFQHDMKETQTNVVQIDDIEPAVLSGLLQYIYTGNVDDLNIGKAIALYSAADKYFLVELKEFCVDIILANLKLENVCEMAVLVDLHPNLRLREAILNMFRINTSDIFKRKEWQDLVGDSCRSGLVSEILKVVSTDFVTNCEDN